MSLACLCGKANCDGDGQWVSGVFALEKNEILLTDTFASLVCSQKNTSLIEKNINEILSKCIIDKLICAALFHGMNENAHIILNSIWDIKKTAVLIYLLKYAQRVDIWKIGLNKYFTNLVMTQELYDLVMSNSIRNVTAEEEIKARPKNVIAYLINASKTKQFSFVIDEFNIEHVRLACLRLDATALQLFNHYKPDFFKQISSVKMMHSMSINESMKPFRLEMAKNLSDENDISGAILLAVSVFDPELLTLLLTKSNKPNRHSDWRNATWKHDLSESVAASVTASCKQFSCYDLSMTFIMFIRSPNEEVKKSIMSLLLPFVSKTSIDYMRIMEKKR